MRRPWYYWAAVILLPGGALLLLIKRARATPRAAINVDSNAATVAAKASIERLIGSAKSSAASLRSGLANDPLAATLIGVNPELFTAPTATEIAADSAEAKAYREQIVKIENQIASANAQYGVDHFGGQTPDQFAAYIGGLQAKIRAIMTKIEGLFS